MAEKLMKGTWCVRSNFDRARRCEHTTQTTHKHMQMQACRARVNLARASPTSIAGPLSPIDDLSARSMHACNATAASSSKSDPPACVDQSDRGGHDDSHRHAKSPGPPPWMTMNLVVVVALLVHRPIDLRLSRYAFKSQRREAGRTQAGRVNSPASCLPAVNFLVPA
jgi:hypothetical protein